MAIDYSALATDFYELTMLDTYAREAMRDVAVFEFFLRPASSKRNFFVAAGLEQLIDYLEKLTFTAQDIAWLKSTGRFHGDFLSSLENFRFTGDVDAMPEGTICFADEPLIRVTAPLPQAQLIESRLINLVHFQTLIASKTARVRLAAGDKPVVDFGFRRAHGGEAGLLAARASYLAGFEGTATVSAGKLFGIPLFGTMAHSFIQAFDTEETAFSAFAHNQPNLSILLIDTYNIEEAARTVARLASRPAAANIRLGGVRIDSGNLAQHARAVRDIFNHAGLEKLTIFVSGGLDEYSVHKLVIGGAPVDGFGVGTYVNTSFDLPSLDCAYKLQEYAGTPRCKRSEGKQSLPGRKQVYRRYDADGYFVEDVIGLDGEQVRGEPLLQPAMRNGKRVDGMATLEQARGTLAISLKRLPAPLRGLAPAPVYTVTHSAGLRRLENGCANGLVRY